VFAKDVMQIFYAGDNKTKGKLKVVLEEKRNIIDLEGVTDEEDYRGFQVNCCESIIEKVGVFEHI
jgi:hypothetical protein